MAYLQSPLTEDWALFQPGVLPGITEMRAHFTEHSFERHSHETYSIGVTLRGIQTFHCRGSLHRSLRGDVILFNPDEAHDGRRGDISGFGYRMLYVEPALLTGLCDIEAGLDLSPHFRKPVVHEPGLGQALLNAIDAGQQVQESMRAEELMGAVFVRLLQHHGEKSSSAHPKSPGEWRMARVQDYLRAHFGQNLRVEQMAKEVGLSRIHLTRAFSARFGVPPHVYLNAVRLERAKSAMLSGSSIADAAVSCGFADQSHFSRRFKGSTGVSPAQWLRQMSGSPRRPAPTSLGR